MYIRTKGKPSKTTIKICKNAIRFYGKILLGENLYHRINLTLEFEKFSPREKYIGYCQWEYDNHLARDFIITIKDSLGERSTLLALAHEMVHLKQYAKGELKDYIKVNKCRWLGEQYDTDNMDYWEQPWEIEAYSRETKLYAKFRDYMKGK